MPAGSNCVLGGSPSLAPCTHTYTHTRSFWHSLVSTATPLEGKEAGGAVQGGKESCFWLVFTNKHFKESVYSTFAIQEQFVTEYWVADSACLRIQVSGSTLNSLLFVTFFPLWLSPVFRIYSRFSSKKMQELTETGLTNFLLLFLVVAKQIELEDVASRACALLGCLPSNCPPGRRTLVWRGQLSLLLLFQVWLIITTTNTCLFSLHFNFLHLLPFFFKERGLDVGAQASWLANSFNETSKEFYDKTTEVSRKIALWGTLSSYLDGVSEVFEMSSNLSLSEEKLLNDGFAWLLRACSQSELNSALCFLQVVLAQLRWVSSQVSHVFPQFLNFLFCSVVFPHWCLMLFDAAKFSFQETLKGGQGIRRSTN